MHRWTQFGALVLAVSLSIAGKAWAGAPAVGDTPQIQFEAVDGSGVDLANMKGKIIVVDFWATWCGPCMAEAAHMVQVNGTYGSRGLQMIGISLDQDRNAMITTAKDKNFTWPQYFDGRGWENKFAKEFSVQSIPFTMVISPDGKVLWTGHPSELDGALERAFKEHPPVLVDPKTVATAQSILAQVEAKLDASDIASAAKLFATVPAEAKLDTDAAARIVTVHNKLGDLANGKLDEADKLIDAKQYPEAITALRALALFPADLPASGKAQDKLRELGKDPKVQSMLAAREKNAKADELLTEAQGLQKQKKDLDAYPRFKAITTGFADMAAATTAAKEVATYEADAAFMEKYRNSAANAHAKSVLSLARNYRSAGAIAKAKAKYLEVIDQFPGTDMAKTAASEMADMSGS